MSANGNNGRIRAAVLGLVLTVACAACSASAQTAPYFHTTQQAPYRFVNTIIRLRFDFPRGIVYGTETVTVRPKRRLLTVPFHTRDIHYQNVRVDGRPATYALDSRRDLLLVHMPGAAKIDAALRIDFQYWAQPTRGIYFVRPDKAYPGITPEIWSQGEPEDNRHWFPTWDEPNEKTPSELILTVPRGWTAIANGSLRSHRQTASAGVWDWNSPKPKSTYLIAFAAGPLVRYHSALGPLNVDSYVQPHYARLNAICFGRTKDMIAYYQRVTGVAFPFSKYDQITAERFAFGGMEDASATIQTDLALHPSVEDVENSCDTLVSHELAQHWYGDDATMADWSNLWLNEGFATYYDELWTGNRFGAADFEYARYLAQQRFFEEATQLRPIVDYVYADPLTRFDANSHERPAAVLHMLRWMTGDARFFRAVHDYLREYAYRNADTHDFFAAIDTSLETDLTWFEREWFFRAAFPHYYVTDRFDGKRKTLTVRVEQRNADRKPFRMPIAIEAFFGGRVARIVPVIDRNDQTVTISNVTSPPDMVLFDPNNNVLRQLTFVQTVSRLAYQLAHAEHVADREWALHQLALNAGGEGAPRSEASTAVGRAVSSDAFWGVRADAVEIAATFGDAAAVRHALHDHDVRVRIAAADAAPILGRRPFGVVRDLERMEDDPDPNVAAAALAALGALKAPGIFDRLVADLDRTSFRQTVAAGALKGLAADCNPHAYALIRARTAYGTQEQERNAAVLALAVCARALKQPQLALPALAQLAGTDPLIGTRIAATRALAILGGATAIQTLERVAQSDSQEVVRESAAQAASAITRVKGKT